VFDPHFKEIFQERTGFYDFESLKKLNNYGNYRKHQGIIDDSERKEMKEWLKRIHTLSLKTFNYVNNDSYCEEFNEIEVERMLTTSEEEFLGIIEYADQIITRKNAVIKQLETEYKDLKSLIDDDTNQIIRYRSLARKLVRYRKAYKEFKSDYKLLIELLGNYIETCCQTKNCQEDIVRLIDGSTFEYTDSIMQIYTEVIKLDQQKNQALSRLEEVISKINSENNTTILNKDLLDQDYMETNLWD
jgi:hypothetical protein